MALSLIQRDGVGNYYMRGTVRGRSVYESTGTNDHEAADAIRIQTESRLLHESIFGRAATATFGEAAQAFIAAGGSPRFLTGQTAAGKPTGIITRLGSRKLHTITQAVLDKIATELYPDALPETRLRQFYAPFRAVWNFATVEGWAAMKKWRMPKKLKGTYVAKQTRRFGSTPTSYEHAADFVSAMSPAPAMVMTALFFTGMRPIELFALEADDVDVDKRWLVVRASKTGEPRGVPIHDFLVPLFTALSTRGGKVFRTHRGESYPILEGGGGQLKGAIRGARERSGIKDISPYTARHTVSTQLVVNGVHPHIKDQILGHAVNDMSRRYTNVPQQPLIDAINGIVVPEAWTKAEWLADPLAWSSKLAGEQGKRTDLGR